MTRLPLLGLLSLLTGLVALAGCIAEEPNHPGGGMLSQRADAAPDDDGGATDAAPDLAAPDPEPQPEGASEWIMVNDLSMGLGVGLYFGTDIDAVTYDCPGDRSGAGVAVSGVRQGNALEVPIEGAIGAPDCPADPADPGVCSTTTGPGGWIAIEMRAGSLSGCTIRAIEVADDPDDRFELWHCLTDQLNGTCYGPFVSGQDGETVEGDLP